MAMLSIHTSGSQITTLSNIFSHTPEQHKTFLDGKEEKKMQYNMKIYTHCYNIYYTTNHTINYVSMGD